MSGRIVGEILDNAPTDLRPAEFLVLIALAEDARERDRLAQHSSVEALVRRTRCSSGTIRNALVELKTRGLIIPQKKTTYRGGYGWQEYTVTPLDEHHRDAIKNGNASLHDDTIPTKRVTPR